MLQDFILSNGNRIAINVEYITAVYSDKDDPNYYTFISLVDGQSHLIEGNIEDVLYRLVGSSCPSVQGLVS